MPKTKPRDPEPGSTIQVLKCAVCDRPSPLRADRAGHPYATCHYCSSRIFIKGGQAVLNLARQGGRVYEMEWAP